MSFDHLWFEDVVGRRLPRDCTPRAPYGNATEASDGSPVVKTYSAKAADIERRWWIVDASAAPLGRLASEIACILRGKNKPIYTPHIDTGDHVIVINCEKLVFTGRKLDGKIYDRYSGYHGGRKEVTARERVANEPEEVVRDAVRGMLPKNRLGRQMLTKLKVYAGCDHPHEAQQPEALTLSVADR